MHLIFSPTRSDTTITLSRSGDVLTIDGEAFDFSGIPAGATLPKTAIDCDYIAGDVERTAEGLLIVPLLLPHGPDAPAITRFPAPITLTADGPVALPPHSTEVSA